MAVDLSKVNYILLKSDGSVLAQSMDYYIQQGSNGVDKIFFGCQAAQNTDIGQAVCTLPNGQQNTLIGEWDTCTYNNETIGGFVFTLGTSQTNYKGGLMIALAIYRGNKVFVNYPLYVVVNETGLMSDTDTGVTVEEINTYLRQVLEMMKVEDGILVVDNISSMDISDLKEGQLIFDRTSKEYYEIVENQDDELEYALAEGGRGVIASEKYVLRAQNDSFSNLHRLYNYVSGGNQVKKLIAVAYDGKDYLVSIRYIGVGVYEACALDLINREIYYSHNLEGSHTLEDLIISANKIGYVEKTQAVNKVYATDELGEQTTVSYSESVAAFALVLRDVNGQIKVPLTPSANNEAASKKYVDDLVATVKKNAYTNVDISTYPTVDSFLASQGEEGYIYLYPINTSEAPTFESGYYQYIWENDDWQYLGTTQIDLSDYYTKSEANALLNGKVDKTNQADKVYGTDELGAQKTFDVDSDIVGDGAIVRRVSPGGQVIVGLPSAVNHAANKKYVDDHASTYYVPYTGANSNVDLGQHTLYANDVRAMTSFTLAASFNYMAIQNNQMVIRTPLDIVLYSQLGKVYYNEEEVATKDYVDDSIAAAIATTYRPMGSKTVAQLNAMTSSELEAGYVYNVLDTGTLTAGNLDVFAGENVAWIVEGGVGRWDKYGAEIDWSAYDEKFMAAGFFEVQNYNESTGEITFVYATDLYDMSYNSDTGVLTIEAN